VSVIAEVAGTYVYGEIPCKGEIGIIRQDEVHGTVYAAWHMYALTGERLGGRTRTYFTGIGSFSEHKLIAMVVEDIRKFRSERTKLLLNVSFNKMT
jgi:hypothetical protein